MNDKHCECLVIILFSIFLGMLLALIFKPKDKFEGPNARRETKRIYLNKKTGKYFQYGIRLLKCPPTKTRIRKIIENFFDDKYSIS